MSKGRHLPRVLRPREYKAKGGGWWAKLVANQPFTWLGHGLVSLGGSMLLAWFPGWWSLQTCAVLWLVFYGLREAGDITKHALKVIRRLEPPEYLRGPLEDMKGDMIGPLLVALTIWITGA